MKRAAARSANFHLLPVPATARVLCIIASVTAAVGMVSIVEESAYRGNVLRRLRCADFESTPLGAPGVLAPVLSGMVLAMAQSSLWLPGSAPRLIYG